MPFPKLRQNTSNQAMRRANTLKKIGSENLTLRDDRAHEITSRIQNMRTARFETDFNPHQEVGRQTKDCTPKT
jgi:hypothetical protein